VRVLRPWSAMPGRTRAAASFAAPIYWSASLARDSSRTVCGSVPTRHFLARKAGISGRSRAGLRGGDGEGSRGRLPDPPRRAVPLYSSYLKEFMRNAKAAQIPDGFTPTACVTRSRVWRAMCQSPMLRSRSGTGISTRRTAPTVT
jgi:hypothetical protein